MCFLKALCASTGFRRFQSTGYKWKLLVDGEPIHLRWPLASRHEVFVLSENTAGPQIQLLHSSFSTTDPRWNWSTNKLTSNKITSLICWHFCLRETHELCNSQMMAFRFVETKLSIEASVESQERPTPLGDFKTKLIVFVIPSSMLAIGNETTSTQLDDSLRNPQRENSWPTRKRRHRKSILVQYSHFTS